MLEKTTVNGWAENSSGIRDFENHIILDIAIKYHADSSSVEMLSTEKWHC